ncbi:MAG: Sec-independent protein translocase subunit TatB [Aquabacterium sp.]|nr:MAG: Sec-independent protein translocase subunit TatB [Aquabacterium sp.]
MLDIGFTKLFIIGGLALIVIGPERLPRVARTVGTLLGRAQRYVSDVKAEVNRSMELEELNKVRQQFETAASDVGNTIHQGMQEATSEVNSALGVGAEYGDAAGLGNPDPNADPAPYIATWRPPKKNWRIKRGAVPHWYKQRQGVKTRAQSGAARVARFRPPRVHGS